jgi:hypothetical protein
VARDVWPATGWPQWASRHTTFPWQFEGAVSIYIMHGAAKVFPSGPSAAIAPFLIKECDMVILLVGFTADWRVEDDFPHILLSCQRGHISADYATYRVEILASITEQPPEVADLLGLAAPCASAAAEESVPSPAVARPREPQKGEEGEVALPPASGMGRAEATAQASLTTSLPPLEPSRLSSSGGIVASTKGAIAVKQPPGPPPPSVLFTPDGAPQANVTAPPGA